MGTKAENPPAFPCELQNVHEDYKHHPGMTLRDYFAAKAMAALLSNDNSIMALTEVARSNKKDPDDYAATSAYEFADAMLKARQK